MSDETNGKGTEPEGPEARPPAVDGAVKRSVWGRLYHGETNIDFVGRKRTWFVLSGILILIGVAGFVVRGGFNLGIDFEGGVVWEVPAHEASVADVRDAVD